MRRSSLLLGSILAVAANLACAQEVALRPGESADLFGVYWVANCKSLLTSFAGADVLTGPSSLRVALREEEVFARRQNCPEKVTGATLVLSVGEVSEPYDGTVSIRVRYNTVDGLKQSVHPIKLHLVPAAR